MQRSIRGRQRVEETQNASRAETQERELCEKTLHSRSIPNGGRRAVQQSERGERERETRPRMQRKI